MSGSEMWRRMLGRVPDEVVDSSLTLAELQARLVAALAKEWADRRQRGWLDVLATSGAYVKGQWQGPELLVLRLHEPMGSRQAHSVDLEVALSETRLGTRIAMRAQTATVFGSPFSNDQADRLRAFVFRCADIAPGGAGETGPTR